MTTECTTERLEFGGLRRQRVVGRFDGGELGSDGGGLLLRELAQRTGLFGRLSACFRDYREPQRTRHPVEVLVAARVLGLALGYEDLNDHDTLRQSKLWSLLCEVAGLAARFEIGVESGLANIDAGDYSWGGNGHCCVVFLSRASRHSCVPVLLRCGSVPTLPLRACRNCCDGPTKLEHGSKGRGGKRSDPSAPGAWAGPRRPPRTRRGGICCRPLRRLPPPAAREERFPDPVWVPALRHLSNIKGGVLRAGGHGEPHQGTAAGAIRGSHLGADAAGQPVAPVFFRLRLRTAGGPAALGLGRHPAGAGAMRHDPPQVAQDRRADPGQRTSRTPVVR